MGRMTPQQKQERIAALEAEIAELKKPEKTAGQRLWELVSGTEVKFDREVTHRRVWWLSRVRWRSISNVEG